MEDLRNRLDDQPFKPFRIHLSDGSSIDVLYRDMVIVGRSTAVLPSRFGKDEEGRPFAERWRTVDLIHMVQFADIDEAANGKSGRRRRAK
jgi:hypothetical protein